MVVFWYFENFYIQAPYSTVDDDGERTELPSFILPTSSTGDVVSHDHYTLSYHDGYEQAEWVAYLLLKQHLTYDDRKAALFCGRSKNWDKIG